MIRSLLMVLLFAVHITSAQTPFIRSTGVNTGAVLRIVPTDDMGWVIASLDSLRISKFDNCGICQWSISCDVPSSHTSLSDFIKTGNGEFVLLTRGETGSVYSSFLTKFDSQGNLLWSKSYGDGLYTHFCYSLNEDQQGNLIILANVEHLGGTPFYNMLCMTDANGNLLWSKFYDHGGIWGGSIVTSDNGILLRTGSTFIKTDNAGNVQWTSAFSQGTYYYLAAVEVSDGYIFSGYNSSSFITLTKMDKSGNLLLGGMKVTDIAGVPYRFVKRANGNIAAVLAEKLVEFDKNLNVVQQSAIDQNGVDFISTDICFLNDGTPVIAGLTSAGSLSFAKTNTDFSTLCDAPFAAPSLTTDPSVMNFITTTDFFYTLNEMTITCAIIPHSLATAAMCNIKYLDLGNDTVLCEGETKTLQNIPGYQFESYLWSTGETTQAITASQSGTYILQVSDACGENQFTDTITITVIPVVKASLGNDFYLCEDSTTILTATSCDSCTYLWSTGSIIDSIHVTDIGTYWLQIINSNGCISSDTVTASLAKCTCSLYLPNAFTPNSDGRNEEFKALYYCDLADYNLKIFNRWGQLIHESDNPDVAWSGRYNSKDVPQDIYVYVIRYRPMIKGKAADVVTKKGTVAVLY